MNKRKTLKILTIAVTLVLLGTTTAFAVSSPNNKGTTASSLKSNGVIAISDDDSGETALIDSSDFYSLADSIDSKTAEIELDVQNKYNVLNTGLQDCFTSVANGKKLLASALATKNQGISEDASFEEINAAILNIQTNITINNISVGKVTIKAHFCTATDEHIVEFKDTETETAYQQYIEYLNSHPCTDNSSVQGGCYQNPVYRAHSHSSSCYTTVTVGGGPCSNPGAGGPWDYESNGSEARYTCSICGWNNGWGTGGHCYPHNQPDRQVSQLICGKNAGQRYQGEGLDYYSRNCGYANGQILSMTIDY